MLSGYDHSPEPKEIPLVCSYCGCDIHKGDKIALVQDGEVIDVFENGSFEYRLNHDTTKFFHKVCKWMKNGKKVEEHGIPR